ncbi:MAG: MFS transporter, partial [Actinomycetota bacterium]
TFGVVGILSPLTGHFGDRFDRRSVMIISESIAAAVFFAMAFMDAPKPLIALAFLSALAESPFWSASAAAIPNLVERDEDIAWANSLLGLGRNAGIMIGPVIGGVLLTALGSPWVFAINGATFVVSVLLTMSVRADYSREHSTAEQEEHQGITAGLRFIWRDRPLRIMVTAWTVFLLGAGMGMVADAPLAEQFGAGSAGFGLLIACWGLGSVVGSLLGRKLTERTEPLWLVLGAAGIAVSGVGIFFAWTFAMVLISLLVMGMSDGITIVAEQGIMMRRSPDAVRSRVTAGFDALLSIGIAIAYIFAGPALKLFGPQGVYGVGGISAGVAAVILLPLLRLHREVSAQERHEGLVVPPNIV